MNRKLKSYFLTLAIIPLTLAVTQCNSTNVPEKKSNSAGQQSSPSTRVPAYSEARPELVSLKPTLPPENFRGDTRAAYQAVKEIPQTIAKLPCYCHCDRGMGHKSLHSCFEDEHAAHCAVCVNEALLAYRLEREQKLSPEEIRERIIAQYTAQ